MSNPPHVVDRTRELTALLPSGADRCIVARPARLPAAQRALVARISQAEGLAWWPELGVEAYAGAFREYRNAPPGMVGLLWTAVEPERVRALLEARGAARFEFGEEQRPCAGNACPAWVRFVNPHVLKIERGRFAQGSAPGAEARCSRMAEHDSDAIELSFARSRSLLSLGLGVLPLTASSELHQNPGGVHLRRFDVMRSIADAERAASDRTAGDVLLGPVGALGSSLRRQQVDAAVQTEYDVLWEDLELARDDETRMRAAEHEADLADRSEPDSTVSPVRREDVLAELGYRLEQIRQAGASERPARAEEARALLAQALASSPDDEGIALMLTELLLDELAVAEPARDLVQRFGTRPGAQPRWAELRRHAAALSSVEALASALVAEGLAKRSKARTLAGDILARLHEGAPYAEAERVVLAGQQPSPGQQPSH